MNGFALIGIAVTLWAIGSGIMAKLFTVPALMWYPVAAAIALTVTGMVLYRRDSLKQLWPESKVARWLLIAAGIFTAINNGLFFTALQYTSVSVAQLTHYLTPLLLAVVFAPFFLNEKPSKREVAITLIGLLGLVIVLWPDLSHARLSFGAVLGAASAIFFALGVVVNRKLFLYNISPLSAAVWQNIGPVFVMLPFLLWHLNQGARFTGGDWLAAAYMGIFAIGIGFSLYVTGLMRVPKANHAGIMTYGEPIGAIILAAIFLHEPITAYVIVGAILIIGSGVALVLGKEKS